MGLWIIEGRYEVCDKVCLGVVLTSNLFCDRSQSSLVDEIQNEGIDGNWVSSGGFICRQIGKFRDSISLQLMFFWCLQLKIIYHKDFGGQHILLPFTFENRFAQWPLPAYGISFIVNTIQKTTCLFFFQVYCLWIYKN